MTWFLISVSAQVDTPFGSHEKANSFLDLKKKDIFFSRYSLENAKFETFTISAFSLLSLDSGKKVQKILKNWIKYLTGFGSSSTCKT